MNLKCVCFTTVCIIFLYAQGNAQEGTITINQDERIVKLLELKKEMNKNDTDSRRYKIQVYSGNRNGAKSAQNEFTKNFSQWRPVMHYEPPNFKIWAGSFNTRLEADRALARIKRKFPSAFIFKPRKK
ncbi:hypothetical protein MHTCC0001_10770 [Flavobacteriaceae bacterium MHTCC 0001]